MTICRKTFLALVCGAMPLFAAPFFAAPTDAQQAPAAGEKRPAPAAEKNSGRDLIVSKCFQCHTDSMFRDQRQDRRAWEATIYRMIGRGGLWTPDEIKKMADYLGSNFGPAAGKLN